MNKVKYIKTMNFFGLFAKTYELVFLKAQGMLMTIKVFTHVPMKDATMFQKLESF